jgi:hypothetical protein
VPSGLFQGLLTLSLTLSDIPHLAPLCSLIHFTSTSNVGQTYTHPVVQIFLKSIIYQSKVTHDLLLLKEFSTLTDVENIFVLPYKIDKQKYEFSDGLKDILAQSLYNYQLTLTTKGVIDESVQTIIEELKHIEIDLKANISRMPDNYENQRSKVKQLLIQLKEIYRDNIDNDGIYKLSTDIFGTLTTQSNAPCVNFNEAHNKIRSITSVCIHLYRTFYQDFGYLIGPFILTLINLVNDLTTTLVTCERLFRPEEGLKLHKKIFNYPELYENPLSMLKYANSQIQIDSIIESMHHQVQDLVRLEVGVRHDEDLKKQEKEELQGIFKIPITPKLEHLMKISKSIFDKTQKDKDMEAEEERIEISQNFPTYSEEFDKDKLFDPDYSLNVDYEDPLEEPNFMTFNSFRNISEKKK